jgi:hypothetical protein
MKFPSALTSEDMMFIFGPPQRSRFGADFDAENELRVPVSLSLPAPKTDGDTKFIFGSSFTVHQHI